MSDGISDSRSRGALVREPQEPSTTYDGNEVSSKATMTLPTDSDERKNVPIVSGCIKYFPAALAGVARISKAGNDKHNPGQPLHHARGKSTDHSDCVVRHLIDVEDLLARQSRGQTVSTEQVFFEVSQLCWRALAYSQELHERFGAPMAPGARFSGDGTECLGAKESK